MPYGAQAGVSKAPEIRDISGNTAAKHSLLRENTTDVLTEKLTKLAFKSNPTCRGERIYRSPRLV